MIYLLKQRDCEGHTAFTSFDILLGTLKQSYSACEDVQIVPTSGGPASRTGTIRVSATIAGIRKHHHFAVERTPLLDRVDHI